MNEELQLHIELQTQALIGKGMAPEEARRQAMIEFGGLENVREEARESWALAWVAGMWRDVRIAVRGLVHEPGYSVVCIIILALAIGANTTVFSLINATFLRSLPYDEPDRIMRLTELRGDGSRTDVNYLDFLQWRDEQTCFSDLAMCYNFGVTLVAGTQSAHINGSFVTRGYFDVLGTKPTLGRDFSDKDDEPGAPMVGILTAGTWREQFNADPEIIGKSFPVDGQMVEIVGVLPDDFRHYQSTDIFIPLGPRAQSFFLTSRANRSGNTVLGRLMPGTDIGQAKAQIVAIADRIAQEHPENDGISADMSPMQEALGKGAHERVLFLYGAVALFLLTACVNLSNMALARGMTRNREMAIRAAIGATRGQLLRQLLVECLAMAMAGGAVGLLAAWYASSFVTRLIPWEIRHTLGDGGAFDIRVCAFALVLTLVTGIIFGIVPALRLSQTKPASALKDDGISAGRRGRFSGGDILTIVQVALVAVLLVTTGLLVRSLQKVIDTPPGIDPQRLVTFRISQPSMDEYMANPVAYARFMLDAEQCLSEIPGVESSAFCNSMAYTWDSCMMNIYRNDRPVPEARDLPFYYQHSASTDIFRTLGIPLLRGRVFDGTETEFDPPENFGNIVSEPVGEMASLIFDCVVSQRMAEKFWPGEDPMGKTFHLGPPELNLGSARVIGIVGNTTQLGAERGEVSEFYIPFRSFPTPNYFHFVARVHGDPNAMMRTIGKTFAERFPTNPLFDMHMMEERMEWFVADRRFTAQILGVFALAALLLSATGIYGLISYVTSRRTREIAIRLTLGATRGSVLWNVVSRGAILVTVGLGLGLFGAILVQKLIRSQLFGVSGTDPLTFVVGALVLVVVGLAACLIPAWKAARVDPLVSIKAQ
jgi:putative ABC transport system permease protein